MESLSLLKLFNFLRVMTIFDFIKIRGARTHNLKNINVDLPRNQLIVITGLSGSGKSSLAFDTLYAEGQRRYVESLSAYARQFLANMEKPDVDLIEGLSPAIAIEQKATSHNPRSTVGTITEIYDYLRLLFARVGEPRCPTHHIDLYAQSISQMVDQIMSLPQNTKAMILAPLVRGRKGEHLQLLQQLQTKGYVRVRINNEIYELDNLPTLSLQKKHFIDVVIDRFTIRPALTQRLSESLENAINLAGGVALVEATDDSFAKLLFSAKFACPECGFSLGELEPQLFSFNNPTGACTACGGLGVDQFFDPDKVVHQPKASLATGAIRGWDKKTAYYYNLISSLAKHYNFDLEMPFANLPAAIQHIILYGSGKELVKLKYQRSSGAFFSKKRAFEGIIPIMQRRYHSSESNAVREELAKYLSTRECNLCQGTRLCQAARHVFINNKNLPKIVSEPIKKAYKFFNKLNLLGTRGKIAEKIIHEITERLLFLQNVGLDYLSLNRSAETLSGGETQRIRLASQIGSGLVGVMYVLDEPSIGLHQRDNSRLITTLQRLRDLGNTVIVVEHDEHTILAANYVLDIGPGAGFYGGEVIACGSSADIKQNPASLTGQYLIGTKNIPIPKKRIPPDPTRKLELLNVNCNNLKNINVRIPLGLITCITGVSGSGKSSLINDTLYPIAANTLNKANLLVSGKVGEIKGLELCDKVINLDQGPIGRTPRSNPATYTGLFTQIRELFAGTHEARTRGYLPGRFSFNVKGGRCEACQGGGLIKVEMHFLPDLYVTCDQCQGKRYNRETLGIQYKGKNIYEVLAMSVEEGLNFFAAIPGIARRCQTLIDVGLGYVCLGQSATTLSGGEAQRVKLARELAKRSIGNTLYILDEPTTGLHFHDIKQLLHVLCRLREQGNTIIIIEHNLDVIKTADWVIDLGPDGGDQGGQIIATGTPEMIAKCPDSYTGQFLKPFFS